ncbi:MFS transporter [Streptomyces sp. GC420]|uniref:MFS transporter n=1 Tax=Streptomyces sp. GC420 TaxID=2697568 RepID=UPI001414FFC1|nr:MFS transporter [Streptomyces sp. GC420]NBM19460.1 MFS transporter [Streptomyces sp. GC420]
MPPAARTLFILLAVENLATNYTSTAMNVALSALVRDLDTSLTGVQSAISLYALVIAALLITGSKLGARHGHRRIFILGGEVFVLGALISTLGPTLPFMLVGWSLLQGTGVALMLPATVSMLTAAFTGATRTKVLSTLGMIGGVGATAAPVVGGLITNYLSWRVSFLMEAVITLAVVLLMRRTAEPERSPARTPVQPFDVLGAVLSATGFGLLVVATLLAGRYGMLRARQDFEVFGLTLLRRGQLSPAILLAGIGLVVLAVFAVWERHLVRCGRDPLVRMSVLRNRTVRVGTETQVMQFLVPTGALFLVPVFLQTTLGFDALRSGITLFPVALGLMVAASAAARLVGRGRMTHRGAQMGAFLFMAAGCVAIALLFDPGEREVTAMGLALAPGLLLIGLGRGMATTVTDLIQSAPRPEEVSDVTGLSRTAGYLGGSFGTALAGAFMTTALVLAFEAGADESAVLSAGQKQLVTRTVEHQVQITAVTDEAVRAKLASRGVTGAAADELVRINARARGQALTVAALGMAVLALAGLLVARRLPRAGTRGPSPG